MKSVLLFIASTLTLASLQVYANEPLTIDEINRSSLSEPEKGLAIMALKTSSVIECRSSNEAAIGSESEQIHFYRLHMSLTVALWKNYGDVRAFFMTETPEQLSQNFRSGSEMNYNSLSGPGTMSLKIGRAIPLVGVSADLKLENPEYVASLICELTQ